MIATKHQERRARKTRRNERIELLREVDELDNSRCKNCVGTVIRSEEVMCGCRAAVRIREIGEELNEKDAVGRPRVKLHLTVKSYNAYKNNGKTDAEIRTEVGITRSALTKWKRENGVGDIRKSRPGPLDELTVQKYRKYKNQGLKDSEVAAKYNVVRSSISLWKRKYGLLE